MGVPRTLNKPRKDGRAPGFIALAERIKKMPDRFVALVNQIRAITFLGNASSHSGPIDTKHDPRSNVVDAMQVMERVLHLAYDDPNDTVEVITQAIVYKRSPRKLTSS